MATAEKLTPPECCPICGAGIHETDDNAAGQIDRVWLGCGATWAMYRDGSTGWKEQCPHAMTACLRCGATLHPTAREQARDALVGGAVNGLTGHDITSLDIHYLRQLAYAYIATLEPRP